MPGLFWATGVGELYYLWLWQQDPMTLETGYFMVPCLNFKVGLLEHCSLFIILLLEQIYKCFQLPHGRFQKFIPDLQHEKKFRGCSTDKHLLSVTHPVEIIGVFSDLVWISGYMHISCKDNKALYTRTYRRKAIFAEL